MSADECTVAFIRWLYWQTAKYNHDDWRHSRWWPWIRMERGR